MENQDFVDDTKDAGELGSGHTVTALYEVIPVGVANKDLKDTADLKYTTHTTNDLLENELVTVKFRYKRPQEKKSIEMSHVLKVNNHKSVSQDFNFAASVAWFALKLRNSKYLKNDHIDQIVALASSNKGKDEQGYRSEFIRLINSYQGM